MTCHSTSLSNPRKVPRMFSIFSEDICLLLYHSKCLIRINKVETAESEGGYSQYLLMNWGLGMPKISLINHIYKCR